MAPALRERPVPDSTRWVNTRRVICCHWHRVLLFFSCFYKMIINAHDARVTFSVYLRELILIDDPVPMLTLSRICLREMFANSDCNLLYALPVTPVCYCWPWAISKIIKRGYAFESLNTVIKNQPNQTGGGLHAWLLLL